ncbi:hypothetical protein E2320_016480 [Naja naja]|nr:hypothetical protein E2320_016480 [Naja naja]
MRGKEDPWNSITSGALTGAVLASRTAFSFRWAVGHGRICYDGRHLACLDRRCWNFVDKVYSPAVPEPSSNPFGEDPSQLPPKDGSPPTGYTGYGQYQ